MLMKEREADMERVWIDGNITISDDMMVRMRGFERKTAADLAEPAVFCLFWAVSSAEMVAAPGDAQGRRDAAF